MAGKDGKILEADIIEKQVYDIGNVYAKSLNPAINANKEWLKSFEELKKASLVYREVANNFKQVGSRKEFLVAKQKEVQLTEQTIVAYKEQERIEKALIAAKERKRIATESTNRALAKERFELTETNKRIKEHAVLSSKLATEYQKQDVKLTQLRRRYKDLAIQQELHGNLTKEQVAEMKRLEVQANRIDGALKKVDRAMGQSQRNVGNYQSALAGVGNTFRSLIGAFGVTSGVMIFAQIMRGAVTTVKEFDSGLKNVQKTTGLTSEQTKELGEEIVDLSRNLQTVGVKSLLQYATVAGQLGVKGTQDIMAFTEALAKLETASDITGEEGGASIARLLTLTDGGVQNISDFGDEIVKLGNNFAATEKEILGNATAIAQNTGIYKLARQEVLAYATATKAVGIESEITGSTIGKTLGTIEKAIRTGKGLEEILALTGKTAGELKKQFAEDSGSVFTDLIKGLNDVDKAGGSVNQRLEKLGIVAIRDQRVIGSLATAGYDTLARAMRDVADASGALDEEFELASSKLENQFSRIGIAWDNLILSLESGEGFISRTLIKAFGQLSYHLDTLADILGGNYTFWEKWGKGLKLVFSYMNFGSSVFSWFNSETERITESVQKSTKAIEKQNKAFMEQHGSLAPLTELQAEYLKNQKEMNFLSGQGIFESMDDHCGAEIETVKDLQEKISALNNDLLDMDKTDIKGIRTKQEKIKVLQKELDAILGISRGTKKAAKDERDYIFEINKFINESKINFLKDFANDEKRDFDLRQTALKTQADLEIALSEYVLENKLKNVKKGSDQERLLLIQAEAEKQAIIKRFEQNTDNLALKKIEEDYKTQVAVQEQLLNDQLIRENEHFADTMHLYDSREEAIEAHEKRVAEIKKKAAIDALNAQIAQIEKLLDTEKFSADERIRLEAKVSDYKKQISDLNAETYKVEGAKRVMTEDEVTQKIIQLSQDLSNTIGDIFRAIFDARIQQHEREIEMSDEKYNKLLEDETLSEQERKRLEDAKENARKVQERKIAQEKRRQAMLDKAMAVMNIGINTAVSITSVMPNPILIALVAALGAAQLGLVAATPIPQYEKGTEDHPGGFALVGEKRPEVISEPGRDPYVISRPTVLDLPKHTKVTPSLDEYKNLMRASILASVDSNNQKMNNFHTAMAFDDHSDVVDKLDEVKRAVSKIKQNVVFRGTKAPDINFQMWKNNQNNWR